MSTPPDRRTVMLAALRRAWAPLTVVWGGSAIVIAVSAARHEWRFVVAAGVFLLNSVWVFSLALSTASAAPEIEPPDPSSRWAVPPPSRRALRWQFAAVAGLFTFYMAASVLLALRQAWSSLAMLVVVLVVSQRWMPAWWARWREHWRTAVR